MKLTVQVVVHPEDDAESTTVVREVFAVDRDALATDTLGLHLCEAQDLLAAVQDTVVTHQVSTALSAQVACPHCGAARRHKDSRPIVMRTLFGTLRVDSPRWWHCGCQPQTTTTFKPLAVIRGAESFGSGSGGSTCLCRSRRCLGGHAVQSLVMLKVG